jgi:signal transduction histidine kinase
MDAVLALMPVLLVFSLCVGLLISRRKIQDLDARLERTARDAKGLRNEFNGEVLETTRLAEQISSLTQELRSAQAKIASRQRQSGESLSLDDLGYLQQALDDSGGRNAAMRLQIAELNKALAQAHNDLQYIRAFAARFNHDSLGRLQLIGQMLEDARDGVTADIIELCKQQIEFIAESLLLNLAVDIAAYVRNTVVSRRNSFNLGKRLERLIDTYKHKAAANQIRVTTEDAAEILLWGKWLHIELLVTNLVSNALKHGREDAPIDIILRKEGSNAVLTVENEGPPLLPQLLDCDGIFDESGGKHFGLFFVRQVASGYSGSVQWKNIRQIQRSSESKHSINRVQVVVTLPAMSAEHA